MAEADSDAPKDVHASRIKSVGTLIASIAALVTACGAYFKPQDHSVNKASYEELTKSIKELSDQADKNHDDIVTLRGYLEGVTASRSAPLPVTLPPDAGAPPHATSSPSASATVAYVQLPPKPPPPPVHSASRPEDPPSFDTVVRKAASKK